MGRKRPETAKSRLEKQLIELYDIKTAQDIRNIKRLARRNNRKHVKIRT
ncbi:MULTISPECIES: hypothetical protein [Helcococcus]|uniref:30S ribosomal protein S20 n=1 Tax=Helcococcus bovis TaxID=3153252 RepID=A0ABW9F7V5_9FIRM